MNSTRYYRGKHDLGDFKSETRHFITTLREGEVGHALLADIARRHWSVENKNHWRKDATVWREDHSARRKPLGAKNLALSRNAILALLAPDRHKSLNHDFIHNDKHPTGALKFTPQTHDQPIALQVPRRVIFSAFRTFSWQGFPRCGACWQGGEDSDL